MHARVKAAIEEIDAAVFNGDTFKSAEDFADFRRVVDRWTKALDQFEDDAHMDRAE